MQALYDRGAGAPVWIDAAGRPAAQARAGLALLDQAAAHGLDPAAYGVAELETLAAGLDGAAAPAVTRAARFDVLMTAGMLRYFREVHLGRVDPRTLGHQLTIPAEEHDFAEIVSDAIARRRLDEAAAEMEPPLPQYQALKSALARYRSLAATSIRLPAFDGTLRPGQSFADIATLRRLLVTLGDLPGDTSAAAAGIYDYATAAGVARFQPRHWLEVNRAIGPATRQEPRRAAGTARPAERAWPSSACDGMPDLAPGPADRP